MTAERREFGVRNREPRRGYRAWEDWFAAHEFPVYQVSLYGWAERDPEARTVSALVYAWRPGDEREFPPERAQTTAYPQRMATPIIGHSYANKTLTYLPGDEKDAWMGVLTIQLDREPAPFPPPLEAA